MNTLRVLPFIIAAEFASAQFAEPKTAAEDPVQRIFPIEAARVLAWSRDPAGQQIAAVSWTLPRSGPEGSEWRIAWLDAAGKTIREREVAVSAAALSQGPEYYRDVLRQLSGEDWKVPSAPPDNAATAFWQGGDLAGATRLGALQAATKLMAEKPRPSTPAEAARLAGLLVHAGTSSLAQRHPMDALLLARGAAWLAIAELRLREPIDAAWGPLLFLSGREGEAAQLWKSAAAKLKLRSNAARFWDLALRDPQPLDAFAFAARQENRAWRFPALYLFVRHDARLRGPAAELAAAVPGGSDSLPDYPLTAAPSDVSRVGWAELAASFPAARAEFTPVAVLTRRELEGAAKQPAVLPAASGRIEDLTDAAAAELAKSALAKSAEPAPSAAAPQTRITPPDFTDADAAWAYLEKLKGPLEPSDSPEDALRRQRLRLAERKAAAERFAATFVRDARRWDARVDAYECAAQLMRSGDRQSKMPTVEQLDELLAAPEASESAKGSAAFLRALRIAEEITPGAPHSTLPFHRAMSEFLARYPRHPHAVEGGVIQLQLLAAMEPPGADKILADLASSPNPQIATQAKRELERRARMTELKKKPLDLKFTAADGREVDAAKLRGKVVLLDFWASWCGPCMADAPQVVKVYEQYRERGFEILGINLDQDRASMEGATKRVGMTWPQHFDGKGWANEVAQRFGIQAIPSTWLFDREGRLRDVGLRGAELEAAIERIFREAK